MASLHVFDHVVDASYLPFMKMSILRKSVFIEEESYLIATVEPSGSL